MAGERDELRKKIQDSNNKALGVYDDAINNQVEANRRLDEAMGTANDEMQKAYGAYDSMLQGWAKAKSEQTNTQTQDNDAQNKKDAKLQKWGAVTNIAAHVANVIGASLGATPMQWESPYEGWRKAADEGRREREARILQGQKEYDALLLQAAQGKITGAKAQADASIARAKAANDGATTVAKLSAGRAETAIKGTASEVAQENEFANQDIKKESIDVTRQGNKSAQQYRADKDKQTTPIQIGGITTPEGETTGRTISRAAAEDIVNNYGDGTKDTSNMTDAELISAVRAIVNSNPDAQKVIMSSPTPTRSAADYPANSTQYYQ